MAKRTNVIVMCCIMCLSALNALTQSRRAVSLKFTLILQGSPLAESLVSFRFVLKERT